MLFGIVSSNYTRAYTRRTHYRPGRPITDTSGHYPVYFPHVPTPTIDADQELAWMIAEAPRRGFRVIEGHLAHWRDPAYVDRIGELLTRHNIRLQTSWSGRFLARDPAERRSIDEFSELARRALRPLGVTVVGTVGGTPINRWVDDPPLDEQIAILSERLGELARVAAEEGITIALENHTDYRSDDLLRILRTVDHPHLRIKLDTGNCMNAIEDPVAAARALAPYVVSTHIKDVRVIPFRPGGASIIGAPLGMGHVDIVEITRILAAQAPEPRQLAFILEVGFLNPADDSYQWVEHSIRWAQEHLGHYFAA